MIVFLYMISLSTMPSMSIHVVANAKFHSILWLNSILLYTLGYPFIHSFVAAHLDCFHILAIVNDGAMNIGSHVSFQSNVFISIKYIPRNGIAGSYGNYFIK